MLKHRMLKRLSVLLMGGCLAVVVAACGEGSGKSYNIGAIFPASDPVSKCAKYGGTYNAGSILEECMVTKEECERAAGEWREAMQGGGIETIEFSCD